MGSESTSPSGRADRLSQVMRLLGERGRLSVADTVDELGASAATIRRDFAHLADQQLVTRTHGGVVATQVTYDLPARYLLPSGGPKDRIAVAAADLVSPGDVVGLNGGTTTSAVARQIGARTDDFPERVTIVTNAVNIAAELVLRDNVVTMSTGGVARAHSYELIGPIAQRSIDLMHFKWMMLGVDSLSVDGGAACQNMDEASVNAAMVASGDKVVVVADASKLDATAFARICHVGQIDGLITDDRADDATIQRLRDAGVDVTVT